MTDPVYPVALSKAAERDLDIIHSYIADQRSPEDADDLVANLIDHMRTLRHFPLRGSIPPELEAMGEYQYRQILHRPYRIIYSFQDGAVMILVIADGRRDMRTLMGQRLLDR